MKCPQHKRMWGHWVGRGSNFAWGVGEDFMEEVTFIWIFSRNLVVSQVPTLGKVLF